MENTINKKDPGNIEPEQSEWPAKYKVNLLELSHSLNQTMRRLAIGLIKILGL